MRRLGTLRTGRSGEEAVDGHMGIGKKCGDLCTVYSYPPENINQGRGPKKPSH